MNTHTWWYLARATGITAWVSSVVTVLWGLALSSRALGKKPRAPWILDLHRFLGGVTVLSIFGHIGALVADSFLPFGPKELLVPMASQWKPGAVTWGVVAFWMFLVIEVSSLLMKRLPRKVWHGIHLTSWVAAVAATAHGIAAGTDATNVAYRTFTVCSMAAMVFFTVYRVATKSPAAKMAG